jgi:hypothetical protein
MIFEVLTAEDVDKMYIIYFTLHSLISAQNTSGLHLEGERFELHVNIMKVNISLAWYFANIFYQYSTAVLPAFEFVITR